MSHKTLTVESRDHLHRFIDNALEEETDLRAGDKDAWVADIAAALHDLARAVDAGAWLAGIRRARVAQRRREEAAAAEARQREAERAAKEKEGESRARQRQRSSPAADAARQGKGEAERTPPGAKAGADAHRAPFNDASHNLRALQQLRALAVRQRSALADADDATRVHHLLLTVAAPDAPVPVPVPSASGAAEGTGVLRCTFSPNAYALPPPDLFGEDPDDNSELVVNNALYGLREWDVDLSEVHEHTELIGGTFSLNGVHSADEHASLVRVLRISIYVLLSLLLEQHFLSDSAVELHYPKPVSPPVSLPQPAAHMIHRNSSPEVETESKHRKRDLLRQGIWSLFSKRMPRSVTLNPSGSRGASLDLSRAMSDAPGQPRASVDASPGTPPPRQRRFSIFGENRAPISPLEPPQPPTPEHPFQTALRRVEDGRALLSTSPGLVIPAPQLLLRLAELERANPARRLTGEERTGLTSLLGWEGKRAAARYMAGTVGFLRQQRLALLYSEHVHDVERASQASGESTPGASKLANAAEPRAYVHCGARARWVNHAFYAGGEHDRCLGDTVAAMCAHAEEPCIQPGCKALQWRHERRWMHGGFRIVAKIDAHDASASRDPRSEEVAMWQSCKVCGESTARCTMSDGTYLFSFAKFLELLLYSSTICTPLHPPCTHTTPPTSSGTALPTSRLNIVRHFAHKSHQVSFTLSSIDDIFELRIPPLQFTRGGWVDKAPPSPTGAVDDADTEKKELRQEIKHWWQAIAEHLDKVEAEFVGGDPSHHKSLPRLPSADDAWDGPPDHDLTPLGLVPASLPPTPTHSHSFQPSVSSLATIRPVRSHSDPSPESTVTTIPNPLRGPATPLDLLTNMRFAFQRAEQALYAQLRDTPDAALNDARREFHSAAHGARRRLAAWEAKHVPKDARARLAAEREGVEEPVWWHAGYHAVPGGSVIVQEEDWGSIIAFTLRCLVGLPARARGHDESPRVPASCPAPGAVLVLTPGNAPFTFPLLCVRQHIVLQVFGTTQKPDPDREGTIWHEPESYSAVISRKEHPRDPTSLMSLREVLRHKVPVDNGGGAGAPSVFASVSRIAPGAGAPPSAWAKPAVEVNLAAVDGHVSGMPEAVVTAGRILHELDGASIASSRGSSSDSAASGFVETGVRRGKAASLFSDASGDSNGTVGPPHASADDARSPGARRAALAEGEASEAARDARSRTSTASTMQGTDASEPANESSFFAWTSSLTNAMRYMLKAEFPLRPASPAPKNHHGLLSADPLAIDERPHIKYDWTIGRRLKFSCTVYYAKQFDALRRRCGVADVFLKSMARCENWKAEGGKSRSNFWKTADDRFIVKTLVNAWNVADLQVLIDLAPSYFLHMETTANRASILAKLLGFYTVEIRNLETGTVQAKADLLVMENLFYDQKPSKTFDLKGIQGRKVKANSHSSASKMLFDSEWIEGQQRALTLVNPVSKVILQEAVRADCDFLAHSNIMDYSLLLGVDEEQRHIYCGLVDTIGSYTFAKTLEYKAKGLSGREGKDITVIPPHEYQERFASALDNYFLACPDKWTKSPDEKKLIYDLALLPSVF
ncbi:hypothetical protein BC834DRAFT_973492 [Gloeopeniophorella convolvens]|nr:hypothetical protein BC834DRAFT_973492 [Gloeopeniophorella convolvens]